MLMFVFMFYLVQAHQQSNTTLYSFSQAQIQVQIIQSAAINSVHHSQCGQLIAMNSQIYSLNSLNGYESFLKQSLTRTASFTVLSDNLTSFAIDPQEELVIASDMSNQKILSISLNPDYSVNPPSSNSFTNPNIILLTDTHIYAIDLSVPQLLEVDKVTVASTAVIDLPADGVGFMITPNGQKGVFWTSSSVFYVFQLSSMTQYGSYRPPAATNYSLTQSVAFSDDSQLAIIQTDNLNPVVVINLNTLSEVTSFLVNQTIEEVHFLNSSNSFLVVMATNRTYVVDLEFSNSIYQLSKIPSQAISSDRDNNVFTCYNRIIHQRQITFTRIATSSSEGNGMESTSGNKVNEEQFYTKVSLSGQVYSAINTSLSVTTTATNLIATFTATMPLTVYFLSFLNYFTLSSLYVLLNFPLPEQVYQYLSLVYQHVQSDFLSILGIQLELPALSDERVNRKKPIFFGVSSDILSSLCIILGFFSANVIVILLLHWLSSKLPANNFFRKLMNEERGGMIAGQLINIMISLTIPWLFVINCSGIRNMPSKVNCLFYLLFFFISLTFPFSYLLYLLQKKKKQILRLTTHVKKDKSSVSAPKERGKNKMVSFESRLNNNKTIQRSKKKDHLADSDKKRKTKISSLKTPTTNNRTFSYKLVFQAKSRPWMQQYKPSPELTQKEGDHKKEPRPLLIALASFDILQQWYICQANFIYPFLVLVDEPLFFLGVILVFSVLGMVINLKKETRRVNSFVLSIYPFLFHLCFLVFYWTSSPEVTVIAELVCLGVYLVGAVHHCLTIFAEILIFVYKMIHKICFDNKISPSPHSKRRGTAVSGKKDGKTEKNEVGEKKKQMIYRSGSKLKKTMEAKKNKGDLKITFVKRVDK